MDRLSLRSRSPWMVALLVLAVCSCGCSRVPEQGQSAGADAGVEDTETDDTRAGDMDAGDAVAEGISDVESAAQDSGEADTTPTADTLPSTDTELPDYCKIDLPESGEPCVKLGDIQCTNHGSTASDDVFELANVCNRPNFVECKVDTQGELRWQLMPCPGTTDNPDAPKAPSCAKWITCMVDGTTSLGCQPLTVVLPKGQPSKSLEKGTKPVPAIKDMTLSVCLSTNTTKRYRPGAPADDCIGGTAQTQCLTVHDLGPLEADYLAAAGPCATYLATGHWRFPLEVCASTLTCPAKDNQCTLPMFKDRPQCKEYFQPKCFDEKTNQPFHDPITGKIRCQKDCHEVGAPGY